MTIRRDCTTRLGYEYTDPKLHLHGDEDDRIVSPETLLSGRGGVDQYRGLHVVLLGHGRR